MRKSDAARPATVAKVSHTLTSTLAERLAFFAFRCRVSESAVIEAALEDFFADGNDDQLQAELQRRGYGLRRPQGSRMTARISGSER